MFLHLSPIEYEAGYTGLASAKLRHYDVSSPQVSPPLRVHFNSDGSSLKIALSEGGREGGILHALLRNSTTARARKGSAAHS